MENRFITKAQKGLLVKVEDQNNDDTFLVNAVLSTKNLCLKEKE